MSSASIGTADSRAPWERTADRIFRLVAVFASLAFLAVALSGAERIDFQVWFGVLLGALALGAFAILSFPTSTGPMERPATPWPGLLKVVGLLLTGAACGMAATAGMSHPWLPATGLFGPLFVGIGAFESWRRGQDARREATA